MVLPDCITPGACPGIRKRGAQNLKAFFCFSIIHGGAQLRKLYFRLKKVAKYR